MRAPTCRLARSEHAKNRVEIVVVLSRNGVPDRANFVDDWVSAHWSSSTRNSSGVQITGGRNPAARHTDSIFSRTAALAIWVQFQVTRKWLSHRKDGNALDRGNATGRSPGITARNLFKHGFRDQQVESIPPRPPFTSDFLMSGQDQVATGLCGQVTDDRSLDVRSWFRHTRTHAAVEATVLRATLAATR